MSQSPVYTNLETVAAAFRLEGIPKEVIPYGNGHINDTFLLVCDDGGTGKNIYCSG